MARRARLGLLALLAPLAPLVILVLPVLPVVSVLSALLVQPEPPELSGGLDHLVPLGHQAPKVVRVLQDRRASTVETGVMVEMACLDLLGVMGFLDLQDPKGKTD